MRKPTVLLIIGARPQFIKSAPIIKEILSNHKNMDLQIVHSGQHYDPEMSAIFFHELHIPKPLVNLRVGSGSHATQTAAIMQRLEQVLVEKKPDMAIVPGDTNTTLGGALAAAKFGIPVAHVEAGLRSGDLTMPEEINRKLTDHCSTLLFAPTRNAASNLRNEGFREQVYLTGDTMVDALRTTMPIVEKRQGAILDRLNAVPNNFVLVTLHRPSNVDDPTRLGQIHYALRKIAGKIPVIFPVHPRTRSKLANLGVLKRSKRYGISLVAPQGYVESLALLRNSGCLLTDSGGMQKESFLLRVPCITLRPTTEWPETLRAKANRLIADPQRVAKAVTFAAFDEGLKRRLRRLGNPFGDGQAAVRITRIVENALH
jgi:UDP-GlcNAc3NAcA epimerase